jgi:hypothetical protein
MNCKMATSKMKSVYLKRPLLIINLASKPRGSDDARKVMAKFVGLRG